MTKIDDALVARMVELVRELSSTTARTHGGAMYFVGLEHIDEARAIVAELPAPVDPDVLVARNAMAADYLYEGMAGEIFAGQHDDVATIRIALAALRRARSPQ